MAEKKINFVFDPTFNILGPSFNHKHVRSLAPILPIDSIPGDLLPEGFSNPSAMTIANLDNIVNLTDLDWEDLTTVDFMVPDSRRRNYNQTISPSNILWDMSRVPTGRGASEYWLWRDMNGTVITEDNFSLSSFRQESDLIDRIRLYDAYDSPSFMELEKGWLIHLVNAYNSGTKWGLPKDYPVDVVVSTDAPTFANLCYQISFVFLKEIRKFVFPLVDDTRVYELLDLIAPYMRDLKVYRLVTSPYPWVYGFLQNVPEGSEEEDSIIEEIEKILEKDGEPTPFGEDDLYTLPPKFYNLNRLTVLWRVPNRPFKRTGR